MKLITLFIMLLVLATGCKKNNIIPTTTTPTTNPNPNPVYNKIGFGYYAPGQYANISSTMGYVIDINALYASANNRVIADPISNQESYLLAGENSYAFTSALTANIKASDGFNLFKGSVSFYDSTYHKSDVIYANYRLIVQQKHIKLNAPTSFLMNYLTPEFKSDLQTQSPA